MPKLEHGVKTAPLLRCWSDFEREGSVFTEPNTLFEVFVHRDDMPAVEPLLAPYREVDAQNFPLLRLSLTELLERVEQARQGAQGAVT